MAGVNSRLAVRAPTTGCGLICSIDAEEMWERIEAGDDVRRELRLLLQQSYLTYCGHHRRH